MKTRPIAIILFICVILASVSLSLTRFGQNNDGENLPPLTCTFLKVGKADAIILQNQGMTMVIDTGEEDDGQEMVDFLKKNSLPRVDVLIITHFDKDHVGGADTLVSQVPVDRVLLPDYEGSITDYTDFVLAMNELSIGPELVNAPLSFPFGEASVAIHPPRSYEIPEGAAEYDNNFSLVTTITHGANRLLFTGDIQKRRIREMVADGELRECKFLKIPHHGVYNTALSELLETVKPKYSVICSSDKNPAEEKTLKLLKKHAIDVLETRHGNITLISDGKNLELRQKVRH